jgi:hypothetical protein
MLECVSSRGPREIRIVEDRWATLRHVIEAVAIVAAGLWAFYTFIYQETIKPAGEPAALVQTVAVHRLGRDAHRDILSIDVRLQNTGKTRIDIAADAYNVWGIRYATHEAVSETNSPNGRSYSREIPVLSNRVIDSVVELRAAAEGGDPRRHIVMEPGATVSTGGVIVVPRGAYDVIHAQVIAVPIKMPVTRKVRISVVQDKSGAVSLIPAKGSDVVEDDVSTDFALVP